MSQSAFFTASLADSDPDLAKAIGLELGRQRDEIELIASENIVSEAVMEAQGSVLTNKYAEGYPGKRYYGGCQFVDIAENLAIDRAKKLFGCGFANVQPNSGCAGQSVGVPRAGDAGRHLHGPRPRGRRPSDPWLAGQSLRQMVQADALHGAQGRSAHRHGAGRGARRASTSRRSSSPAAPAIRASGTSRPSARSRIASAPISWSIWRISPASWRRACIPRPSRMRMSSPPPRIRRCAARAAAWC